MANNSGTIVAAALDSTQLEQSINKLVSTVAEKTKQMADNFTSEVARMEQAVKNLGNIKIDSGGAADGGSSRRTKSLSEESLKAKEVTMSYDQMQAAFQRIAKENSGLKDIRTFNKEELQSYIDLLRRLQAEYVRVNTQEGGGAKSDQIKRDMNELEKIIQGYQTILRNVEAINSRQGTIDVKKWTQDIGAVDDRYKKLVRWYTVLEKEDQRRIANEEKANQKRLAELDKEEKARQKMIESARKAEEKYQNAVLKTAFNKIVDMPSNNIDQMRSKLERLQTILANIRELGILSPKDISNAETEISKLRGNIQQIEKIEKERIAAERQFVIEQQKEIENLTTIEGRVRSLSQATKQYFAENKGEYWRTFNAYGKDFTIYNPEKSNRANGLSIEEQITNVLKEEKSAREGVAQSAQQQSGATQNVARTQKEESEAIRMNFRDYDTLRQAIASVLGIRSENVRLQGVEISSINNLSNRLKELRGVYNQLGTQDRHSERGKELISQIQNIEHQMDRARKELSRPIDLKSALGTSEKTLDDIAYKMRQLASYRSGLNVETQKKEINTVNQEYDRLKKKMDEVMQKNQSMIASNNTLSRSWNYMKNRLAFYFTVGASTQFIKNLIEVRSQYEMNERALGILINSAERGTQIFNELSQMALVSPYTLIELSAAAKQLTAYDIAAKDVVDTTRRLADMASAVGVPIERLTYALGQIKAYGYLNSRDARMFANAGIPLVKELADHYTRLEGKLVSTADVYDRIKKKAIDYNDVMQVMNEMTDEGGRFYDFQAKMADTLKVQLANLTLAWNNMLNDLGNSQQGILTGGISALKELFLHWQDINRLLTNVAITLGTAKAAQLLLNLALGKGTLETIRKIGSLEGVTAAQYKDVVATASLTKAQAKFLVAINRNNVALRAAIVQTGILTAKEAEAATTSKLWGVNLGVVTRSFKVLGLTGFAALQGLWAGVKSVSAALWSIATNPLFIAMTAIMAVVDAMMYYNQIAEKTAEMNKAIADNAKEASDALGSYLKDTVNIGNRAKAIQGMLSVSEGQKAWDSLREQIELSSDAAGVFVAKLLEEEDINKRVKEGFDVAESIREATNAMAGLNAEALKVSQDSWLWGAFGEGLAEDLEDYIEKVQEGRKNGANIGSKYFAAGEFNEAMKELKAFANDAETIIRDRLGAGVKDAVQLKEAVERIKKEVIAANPQIKGEVKKWFDVEVDRMMAERFEGVYNELSSIQSQFIEHIKRDSGAALRRLSDDILDTSKELDDEVLGAISKAWDKLKNELPAESQDLISKLQKQMDENPLTLRVLLLEAGEKEARDAIQKDYEEHFYDANIGEKPKRPKDVGSLWGDYKGDYNAFAAAQEKHEKEMVEYNQKNAEWEAKRAEQVAKYGEYNKKNDESRKDWAKRVNDSIKAAKEEQTAAQHTIDSLEKELSLEERKTDVRYQQAVADRDAAKVKIKNAEDAYNYEKLYQEEKKKGGGSKKDPLLDALKQEISLVEKLQSDYDKLTKSGSSQADALDTIRGAYGKTIRLLNTQLQSYGLPQIDISQLITGKDPHKALEHFKTTLDTLVSKGLLTFERSKELEAVVEKFTLSAKTYDLDKITKGLNSELDRLKEEYELAVSLDADPELGGMFADMFDIDTSDFPKTIDEFMSRAQQEFDNARKKFNLAAPLNIFTANNDAWYDWGKAVGYSAEQVDNFKKQFDGSVGIAKKWAQDTAKQVQDLQYKLSDNNGKIAIEEEKLANLRQRLAQETNDKQRELLNLQIQDQQNAIAKLKEEILQMLPTYQRLFGAVAEHSAYMTRQLAKDYKKMLTDAQKRGANADGTYTITDPLKGKSTSISKDRLGKEIKSVDKELRNTQSTIDKITEAFTKGEDGVVDWAQGVELVGEELGKLGQFVDVVGNIVDAFGNPNEYNATAEAIHDIATSLQGVATAAQGIGQIASGDYIGGAVSVASGLFSAISSWFDNADKKTLAKIEDSERAVKRLELAYIDLEHAVNEAYGMATIGANMAAKANKELQLVELKRQLALERSRDSKHRDEDRIIELQKQIKELEYDIADTAASIVNDLLGISSVGDAMENMMDAFIEALRSGEDAMATFDESVDEMIANMVKKMFTTKILQPWFEEQWNKIQEQLNQRAGDVPEKISEIQTKISVAKSADTTDNDSLVEALRALGMSDDQINLLNWYNEFGQYDYGAGRNARLKAAYEKMLKEAEQKEAELQKELTTATMPTTDDIRQYAELLRSGQPIMEESMQEVANFLRELGLMKDDSSKNLSALQQGIQGITEDTAGALEAYMNGVSQQAYLRNDLLVQIRDTIMSFDMDVQLGVFSQMLLQLQNNYIVMQSMQSMMEGWTTPSGQGIRVELLS